MARRKLNKKQLNRIANNQLAKRQQDENLLLGLVTTHYGSEVDVIKINQAGHADKDIRQRCHFRANLPNIVCGDRVMWKPSSTSGEAGIIEALLDRHTLIERPRPYSDPKPVVANINTIILVISPKPEPIASLIDRYLIAAEIAGIEVIILLNKSDLLTGEINQKLNTEIDKLLNLYRSLDYPVFCSSTKNHSTFNFDTPKESLTLKSLFIDKTSILVGQSGVGKSSIINTIVDNSGAATGSISSSHSKGRHTTTTAELYFLKHNADDNVDSQDNAVIDSPGIREFGLWHLSEENIIDGLREFRHHAQACKFRDCEHGVSKGCALQIAFDNGTIHPSRVASYQHILNSREQD